MDINIVNQNVKSLAAALCSVGAVSATVQYSGYGDSGNVDEISIGWPETVVHRHNPVEVTYLVESYQKNEETGNYETAIAEVTANFNTAFEDVMQQAVSCAGHEGWENSNGGGGTFTANASNSAELDHHDNIVDVVHDYRTFGENSATASPAEAI